jgi:hypothetical protein
MSWKAANGLSVAPKSKPANVRLHIPGIPEHAPTSQYLDTKFDSERDGTKGIPKLQTMISLTGLRETRKLAALLPVEFATIHYNPTNGRAMSSDPFGSTVDDNIGTKVNGAHNVASRAERIIYDERNVIVMGYLGKLWDRCYIVLGVPDAFDVESFGVLVDCCSEGFRFVVQNKLDSYSELLEQNFELVIGPTVEV